jgi:hypothetical protein
MLDSLLVANKLTRDMAVAGIAATCLELLVQMLRRGNYYATLSSTLAVTHNYTSFPDGENG